MSSEAFIASRQRELDTFFQEVQGTVLCQRQYLASWLMETQGKPDSYSFIRRDGKLLDPTTGKPISTFIRRDSYIGFADGVAFDKIEAFSRQELNKPIIWISPSYGDIYPVSKIIVSEIVGDQLQNWSIKLNCDNDMCIKLANTLEGFEKYNLSEQVRLHPIVWDIPNDKSWVDELSQIFFDEPELIQANTEQAQKDKEEALRQADDIIFLYQNAGSDSPTIHGEIQTLVQNGAIGTATLSCPSMLAGEYMTSQSGELKFVRQCGDCGVFINKLIGKGYKCTECGGIYQGC
jgi:hypothetical protein